MTLQQIRYILEISRCGSISKAAQQLLLTQPYLSSILKDLENELGIVIFRRDRPGRHADGGGAGVSLLRPAHAGAGGAH